MKRPSYFARSKRVVVPDWAVSVRLVTNGIDGYPPFGDRLMTVGELKAEAHELQVKAGRGEWDVLVYATNGGGTRVVHPYGVGNRYRRLRSKPGGRVKLIGSWSYMAWDFHTFVGGGGR